MRPCSIHQKAISLELPKISVIKICVDLIWWNQDLFLCVDWSDKMIWKMPSQNIIVMTKCYDVWAVLLPRIYLCTVPATPPGNYKNIITSWGSMFDINTDSWRNMVRLMATSICHSLFWKLNYPPPPPPLLCDWTLLKFVTEYNFHSLQNVDL